MQSVWTVPSTAVASGCSRLPMPKVVRSKPTASIDAGVGVGADVFWVALIGGSVAAATAGRRLASGRLTVPGQVRGTVVAVRATETDAGNALVKEKSEKADAIQKAAAELTEATYPFMQEVPWNSDEFCLTPGKHDPILWTKAVGKIIGMGADMDAELVKAGCHAHHVACTNLPPNGVCSEAQLTNIYAAIGHMIASVPESQTMEVYDSVSALVRPDVPTYLMSKVTEENARTAYDALIKFTEVVKANPITPSPPTTAVSSSAASCINQAANELGKAAYPFMQGVDWTDDLWAKPVPGRSAQEVLRVVSKMIMMGTKMDSAALQEAARAHVKAIEGIDAKGVLTQSDFEAILAGLGKVISSVPESTVMGVYNDMNRITGSSVPPFIFSKQNPVEAIAAYSALMKFKDTVKAFQPSPIEVAAVKLAKETYPFMQEVPWNSFEFLQTPGAANPIAWTDAIGQIIDMGASMDAEIVKAACEAHHAAIVDLPENGVCSEAQLAEIYATIGRMIASVPESKTMQVYYYVSALVDKKVPEYLMSKVTEKNARAAYDALLDFTRVVKRNPITPSRPTTSVSASADSKISAAASKLAEAAYPFMKGVDWTDSLWAKAPPGKDAQEVLKAVDKMIVMGTEMDGAALQEAARAHVRAIRGKDSKGVLAQKDLKAILAGLGKAISSVPESTVMDVYDEMSKLAGESTGIPEYIYSKQNPVDALAAYGALMEFKDTVRAYQPDAIGAAAAKLSNASYSFMQQVPWNSFEFLLPPGKADPIGWTQALGKMIDMGASMDGELVKAGCLAHHNAIVNLPSSSVCSQAQLTEIYAAIGRMIASVPESQTMGVYESVKALVDPKVPEYLMAKVTEADAKAAYDALIEFTEVVKANPIKPSNATTVVSSSDASAISAAASELGKAAYPFMKGVDWTDDLWAKAPPGRSAQEVLKAVDKMIVMGSDMDWAALQEAARAHAKAIESMDAKGVLTQGDFNAILAGLGKAISSVPETSVMDVYTEMNTLAGTITGIPNYIYSKQNPADAMAAYGALLQFKDTVKAAQPKQDRKLFVDVVAEWQLDPAVAGLIVFLAVTLPSVLVPVH
mmetsp:Transcript_518/g.956  ORF Transcript_518/g.956 Transcript_518/m.956 type:complete len:1085 (-) Transcript_518:45-3299(-)